MNYNDIPLTTFSTSGCATPGESMYCMTPEKFNSCTKNNFVSTIASDTKKTSNDIGAGISEMLSFLTSLEMFGPISFITNLILLGIIYWEISSLQKTRDCTKKDDMMFKLNFMNTLVSMNAALSLLATIVQYDKTSTISQTVLTILSSIMLLFNIGVIVFAILYQLDQNTDTCKTSSWTWLIWLLAGILTVYIISLLISGFTYAEKVKTAKNRIGDVMLGAELSDMSGTRRTRI